MRSAAQGKCIARRALDYPHRLCVSDYRTASDHFIHVIEIRARCWRNQVVAVVSIGGCSIVWAILARSFLPLAGLLLLVPVCGWFLFADRRALYTWHTELFASWARREIDFFALAAFVRAIPGLPKETLEGMLGTLPVIDALPAEQAVHAPTRQAVAATALTLSRMHCDSLAFKSCTAAVVTMSALMVICTGRWLMLGGLASLCLLAVARACVRGRRLRQRDVLLDALRRNDRFDPIDYARLVSSLR
jgi:hypothetical protein